jgi:hypothetical protein
MAAAAGEEIINLHLYLDTKAERAKRWKGDERKSSVKK